MIIFTIYINRWSQNPAPSAKRLFIDY
jgi:hypothetical protein